MTLYSISYFFRLSYLVKLYNFKFLFWTVDGFNKCEKWERSDTAEVKDSRTTLWLNRFTGRAKKPEMTWPFPFVEGKLFVLTLQAGIEGYHIYIGGRHVTSFPYRPVCIIISFTKYFRFVTSSCCFKISY